MRGPKLPLHYRHITVALPSHLYRRITVALPSHYRRVTVALPSHYRRITVALLLHYHRITVALPITLSTERQTNTCKFLVCVIRS